MGFGKSGNLVAKVGSRVLDQEFCLTGDTGEDIQRTFADEPSLRQNADAVADFLDLLQQMGSQQDGLATCLQLQDQIADLARPGGVDPCGGLIEDQQAWIVNQGLGEANALEHPLGVSPDATACGVPETDEIQQFPDALLQLEPAKPAEFSIKRQRLRSREELVEVGVFGKESDPFATGDGGAWQAKDLGASRAGRNQSQEDLERGALARTVRAEKAKDLPFGNVERQVVQCNDAPTLQGHGKELFQMPDPHGGGDAHLFTQGYGIP